MERFPTYKSRSYLGCWAVALAVVTIIVCLIGAVCSGAPIDRSRPVVGGLSTPGRTGEDLKTLPRPLPKCFVDRPLAMLVFSAKWCEPCKQQEPVLDTLGIPYIVCDIDQYATVAKAYRVKGVPTVLVGVYGREIARVTGAKPQRQWAIRAKVWRIRAAREAEMRRRVE